MSMQTFTAKIDELAAHIDSCNWCSQLKINGKVPSFRQGDLCWTAQRIKAAAMAELYNGIPED